MAQQQGDADSVWVVVPAYNEDGRLADTLEALLRHCPNVVVVDDGSDDDTSDVAARFDVWVLRHLINCGQGAALQTGIDFALLRGAAVVVTFDADGQHCPEEVGRLVEPIRRGAADVVLGSRFLGRSSGMPLARWLLLKAGVAFTRLLSGVRVSDTHNGFRAFSRAAAQKIRITQGRMAHASEILDEIARQRLRYVEVPVTVRYTADSLAKGQSSWNAVPIALQVLWGKWSR